MRLARLIFTAAVASAAALAFAAPAAATDVTIPLHGDHTGKLAGYFSQECNDERFDGLAVDQDGWHFVLRGNGEFVSITVSFDPDGVEDGVPGDDITYTGSPGDPGDFMFYGAGENDKHAYLFTPAGYLLVAGEAVATSGQMFNVSHTCVGGFKPSPSPSPSPSESRSMTSSPSPSEPGLPKTGSALTGLIGAGVIALVGGAALLAVRRRRDLTEV